MLLQGSRDVLDRVVCGWVFVCEVDVCVCQLFEVAVACSWLWRGGRMCIRVPGGSGGTV